MAKRLRLSRKASSCSSRVVVSGTNSGRGRREFDIDGVQLAAMLDQRLGQMLGIEDTDSILSGSLRQSGMRVCSLSVTTATDRRRRGVRHR